MSETVTTLPVVAGFSADDIALILAAKAAQDEAEKTARADARSKGTVLAQQVTDLIVLTGSTVPRQTFQSGAEGWSIGGKFLAPDGNTYKVSILLRDVATIPAA